MRNAPLFKFLARLCFVLTLLVFVNIGARAYGADQVKIAVPKARVFIKPDQTSQVIAVIPKGAVVMVASTPVGNFKKALVVVGGQKKFGFISLNDLRGAPVKTVARRGVRRGGPITTLRDHWAIGFNLGVNYESQGASTYSTSLGDTPVGSLSGAAFMFGGFIDIPASPTTSIEAYVMYKPISASGTASISGQNLSIALSQNFVSFGAKAKFYNSLDSSWWYGVGLQLDHGLSGTLQEGNLGTLTLTGSSLPNFLYAYATTGLEFPISKSLQLVPDIRLGAIFNTSPIIIEADLVVGLAYVW